MYSSLLTTRTRHSRKDAALGDPIPFDESVFAQTKATWAGLDNIDISASAQGRAVQIRNSMQTNPQFKLSAVARAFLAGESAAYLMVFGDAETGVAPRLDVEYFFGRSWENRLSWSARYADGVSLQRTNNSRLLIRRLRKL